MSGSPLSSKRLKMDDVCGMQIPEERTVKRRELLPRANLMSTEKLRREQISLAQSFEIGRPSCFGCTVTLHREGIDLFIEIFRRSHRLFIVPISVVSCDRMVVLSIDLFLICRRRRRADSGETVMAGEGDKCPSVLRNRK